MLGARVGVGESRSPVLSPGSMEPRREAGVAVLTVTLKLRCFHTAGVKRAPEGPIPLANQRA